MMQLTKEEQYVLKIAEEGLTIWYRRQQVRVLAKAVRRLQDEAAAEIERLQAFRSAVCDALGECTACLPVGETWAATDDSVIQYIADIVVEIQKAAEAGGE